MKTYMADGNLQKKWYIVDAKGKTFGRLASQVAAILIGKNKPEFTPNVDTGDYVIVINSNELVLTGKKLEKKLYRTHSDYIGSLKEIQYRHLMENRSDFAFREAVRRMLPKSRLGRQMINKLHVYKTAEHEQQAQCPVALNL